MDCGCTASLIGEDLVPEWKDELAKESKDKLATTEFQDDTKFRRIGGTQKAVKGIKRPAELSWMIGQFSTPVVPGPTPCLMSVAALREMDTLVSFNKNDSWAMFMTLHPEKKIPLVEAPNGHLLVPLFEFTTAPAQRVRPAPTAKALPDMNTQPVQQIRRLARETKGPWVYLSFF